MKKTILIVFLTVMVGIGWFSFVSDAMKENNKMEQVEQLLANADAFVEDGLYQRAIQNYKTVLEYNNTEENWTKLMNAYEKRYAEDANILSDYIASLESAVEEYPKNRDFLVKLVDFYIMKNKYENVYNVLSRAETNGLTDDELMQKKLDARYIYSEGNLNFDSFIGIVNGSYMITKDGKWGSLFADGSKDYTLKYEYLSPMSSDKTIVITTEKDSRLTSNDGTTLGIFSFRVNEAGLLSQGLIPVKDNNKYAYYNTFAQKQDIGEFEKATTFVNGKAAVKNDGSWFLIDTSGEKVSDNFADIVMANDECYFSNGVMIAASEPGKYGFYDEELNRIGDFTCENIDISSNTSLIAFEQNGKWGFVDTKGNIVIEPQYESAKSFSYGLAAVCKDGKWGFINKDNRLVIKYQYTDADYFNNSGCCIVKTETVDADGQTVVEFKLLKLKLGI